jgi:Uma2 family endonuclease
MAKARAESELPRTVEAFDRWNAEQPERWEFIGGVPLMMAPATNNHSIIKGNIFAALHRDLRSGTCRAIVDGPEVRSAKVVAIPDVVVTCQPIDGRAGVVRHPIVLVEVLSPSSERDDTGRKWRAYCLIPSLQHYLVVSRDERFLTLHTRTGPSSFAETVHSEGSIELTSLGVTLAVEEIYDGIDFEAEVAADDA